MWPPVGSTVVLFFHLSCWDLCSSLHLLPAALCFSQWVLCEAFGKTLGNQKADQVTQQPKTLLRLLLEPTHHQGFVESLGSGSCPCACHLPVSLLLALLHPHCTPTPPVHHSVLVFRTVLAFFCCNLLFPDPEGHFIPTLDPTTSRRRLFQFLHPVLEGDKALLLPVSTAGSKDQQTPRKKHRIMRM